MDDIQWFKKTFLNAANPLEFTSMRTRFTRFMIPLLFAPLASLVLWIAIRRASDDVRIAKPLERNTTVVALIIPLTGTAAEFGQHEQNAAIILRDEVNSSSELTRPKIELAIEDSKGEGKAGVAAIQKVLSINRPIAAYTELSSVSLAVAPIAQEHRLIMISVAANPALTNSNSYAFRNFPEANRQALEISRKAFESLRLRRIAILNVHDDFGEGLKEAFARNFQQLGGQISQIETFPPDGIEFRDQITSLIAGVPDAVYVVGYGKPLGTAIRQLREQGYSGTILSGLEVAFADVLTAARGATDGVIYLDIDFDPNNKDPKVSKFVEEYKKRFGKTPSMVAALAYDGLSLVVEAARTVGNDPDKIRHRLLATRDFIGLCGKIHVDEQRNIISPLVMKTIKDGMSVPWTGSKYACLPH